MKSKMMLVLAVLMSLTGLFTTSVQAQSICDNEVGTQGGYTYEYWKDNGTGCMILGDGGTFSIDWSNINNLLARKGLRPGSKSQVVNYSANYQPNGNSYLCVYGWTTSPLVEYYIVESWGTWRPPGATSKGTITVDGGTYDVYETTRTQQPSIEGTATFQQYWSVRTSKKTSGTIHVGQHFDAWASMGMSMGSLYEVSFCVEGYQSSGSCDVTSMTMTLGDDDDGDDDDDDDGDDDDDDDGTYTQVTAPFTQDGAGTYKWMVSSIPSYVNSWNMDSVTINGVDYTNTWVSASNLPAKQNGYYYIDYKASFAWSHLEVR